MRYHLTEEDKDIIILIKKNTDCIYSSYQKLRFIETENYGTYYRDQELNELKRLKAEEDTLYEKLQITPKKARTLMDYVLTLCTEINNNETNVIVSFLSPKEKEFKFFRMINKIEEYGYKNDDLVERYHDYDQFILINDDLRKYIETSEFKRTIYKDMENSFITFNDEEIKNCDNQGTRQMLIGTKYRLSLISSNVEETMISNNLSPSKDIIISYPVMSSLYNITDEEVEINVSTAGFARCCYSINKMIIDIEKANYMDMFLYKSFTSYLRSALTTIYPLKSYNEMMKSLANQVMFLNTFKGEKSEQACLNVLEYLKKGDTEDKNRCKYLKLGRR